MQFYLNNQTANVKNQNNMQKISNANSILPVNLINQGKNENFVISAQTNSTQAVYKTNTLD